MPAAAALFLRFHDSYGLFIWARLTRPISPWVHMRNFSPVSEMSWRSMILGTSSGTKGQKRRHAKHKNYNFRAIAFATLKAVSLQLIAMVMMRKIQQANARRCHLGQNSSCFHPGNRAEESYGKIPRPLTEIPVGKNRDLWNRASLPCHMNTSRQR